MTQEEKDLLLKDLCARLLYGVKVEYIKTKKQYRLHELSEDGNYFSLLHETEPNGVCSELGIEYEGEQIIKPYLRPMGPMTEKEKNKINTLLDIIGSPSNVTDEDGRIIDCSYECIKLIDFYNSRYLDFRGLIPMGLAIEAPEGMYEIK